MVLKCKDKTNSAALLSLNLNSKIIKAQQKEKKTTFAK